ncbi:MAG: hypothetical protein ACW990_20220, partial [Promethearchaeota archaeon]
MEKSGCEMAFVLKHKIARILFVSIFLINILSVMSSLNGDSNSDSNDILMAILRGLGFKDEQDISNHPVSRLMTASPNI